MCRVYTYSKRSRNMDKVTIICLGRVLQTWHVSTQWPFDNRLLNLICDYLLDTARKHFTDALTGLQFVYSHFQLSVSFRKLQRFLPLIHTSSLSNSVECFHDWQSQPPLVGGSLVLTSLYLYSIYKNLLLCYQVNILFIKIALLNLFYYINI